MATSDVNAASTAPQFRQDFQYSASVDGLLKQVYIPALNNTIFHATPLMEMFGEFGGVIDFVGNKIIKAFKHQGAGGFGGIPEGGSFVTAKKQTGFQGYERIKFLNAFFSLTGPAVRTIRAGEGAYVDAVPSAMDDTLRLGRMQMERIIGGSGNGTIASFLAPSTWNSGASTAATITLQTKSGGYTAAQWLCEGLRVDLCTDESGTIVTSSGGSVISAVDYEAGTATLTPAASITVATGDEIFLTLEDAYGDIEAPGTVTADSILEPNGLYNLVDDGDTYSTIWNLTRSTYPHALKSTVKAAASAELDEELLIDWILDLVNIKQSTPNVLVTDPKSRLKYFSNRKEDRRFDMTVMDSMFGFKSIGVVIDQYSLLLQSLTSLTPGTLFMLNTGDFKFARATNGFEWIEDGGKILRNFETSDAVFGTAVSYMNFVCENPNGQLKATGLSYS